LETDESRVGGAWRLEDDLISSGPEFLAAGKRRDRGGSKILRTTLNRLHATAVFKLAAKTVPGSLTLVWIRRAQRNIFPVGSLVWPMRRAHGREALQKRWQVHSRSFEFGSAAKISGSKKWTLRKVILAPCLS